MNCVEMTEKFLASSEFGSVTSRCRCDAPTDWTMKPEMVEAGHLWVETFPL